MISSYYFYMSWKPEYVILIFLSTIIDYFTGIKIHNSVLQKRKNFYLGLSLFSNLGMLFVFKYFNFFSDSFRALLQQFSIQLNPITLKVLLPIGISFYTFQTLSYTIDIYRGKIEPQKHFGIFAVYVSFFPQLVAGPIERANNLLPQFFKEHYFDYKRVTDGLKLMLWGFFKKVVIADRLSIIVNTIYNNPTDYTGIPLILATLFFAYQIYCDFSGYSDIAIGASQVMGFRLMDNFKRPYLSRSLTEFWRRWHISLSTWFKDYVYIPLGGNRVSIRRWYVNLLVVFIVSGLWHGANWTFVIWGALHGSWLIIEIVSRGFKRKFYTFSRLIKFPKLIHLLEIGLTFSIVNLGWIFFRANSLSDAVYIVTHLFGGSISDVSGINIGAGWSDLIIGFSAIGFMEFIHLIQEHVGIRSFLSDRHIVIRWIIYFILIFSILLFGVFNQTQFIYFQF